MEFTTTVLQARVNATGLPVPPEVIEALGSGKRPAVVVTIDGGHSYRSTVGVRCSWRSPSPRPSTEHATACCRSAFHETAGSERRLRTPSSSTRRPGAQVRRYGSVTGSPVTTTDRSG
jgi:hypothetical protein